MHLPSGILPGVFCLEQTDATYTKEKKNKQMRLNLRRKGAAEKSCYTSVGIAGVIKKKKSGNVTISCIITYILIVVPLVARVSSRV